MKLSLGSKVPKRWKTPRIIMNLIVGCTVFSYVSYIVYELSRSIINNYSKSSLIDENDPSWMFAEKLNPCSSDYFPCKDIPNYFKGMILHLNLRGVSFSIRIWLSRRCFTCYVPLFNPDFRAFNFFCHSRRLDVNGQGHFLALFCL